MKEIVMLHDTVEANGKTVRENNLEQKHTIPLKTFVEINCTSSESHGCRGFVVDHGRDCDGEPLYGIGFKTSIVEDLVELKDSTDDLGRAMYRLTQAEINGGWGENSLIVIRPACSDEEQENLSS